MKRLRLIAALVLGVLLLVSAPAVALAAPGLPDEIVVGEDFTLAEGETLQGDLVVYGGDAVLEEGSHVTGEVVVVGGSLDAAGEVDDNVVVVGGDAELRETAVIGGDLVAVSADVSREPGAEVRGQEVTTIGRTWTPGDFRFGLPFVRWSDLGHLGVWQFFQAIGWSLTMGVLALVVLALWPDQTARVSQAALNAPLPALGMGLLTAIAGAVVFTVLILAACLGLLGWLALVAASLFGSIALGALLGARLTAPLRLTAASPVLIGAIGTALLTLVLEIVRALPCFGPLLWLAAMSLGLGAVVLTRFGTQPFFNPARPPAPPMPPVVVPPPVPPPVS